jgi:hypothetical protein
MASDWNAKRRSGQLGGRATVARYGREHMSRIGRRGAQVFWQRYRLLPAGLSGWAIVERETGKVRTFNGHEFKRG